MPRPIIGVSRGRVDTPNRLTVGPAPTSVTSRPALDKRLRQKRSPSYVETIKKLDAGEYVRSPEKVQSLLNAIREELPEVTIEHLPIGIVSKCFLGDPFEVHTLDVIGGILQHYKRSEHMPDLLERARNLASPGIYAFIEVYSDCLRTVDDNGTISVVQG